jgi:hypothetical protein
MDGISILRRRITAHGPAIYEAPKRCGLKTEKAGIVP